MILIKKCKKKFIKKLIKGCLKLRSLRDLSAKNSSYFCYSDCLSLWFKQLLKKSSK